MRNVTIILAVLAVVALAGPAQAAWTNWNGDAGIWNEGSNWSDGVPTASLYVMVNGSGACNLESAGTLKSLYLGNGDTGTLNVSANLTQPSFEEFYVGRNGGNGSLIQTDGTVTVQAYLEVSRLDGDVNANTTGLYEISGGTLYCVRGLTVGSGGHDSYHASGTFRIDGSGPDEISATRYNQNADSTLDLQFGGGSNPIQKIDLTRNNESGGSALAGTLSVTGTADAGTYVIIDYSGRWNSGLTGTFSDISSLTAKGWSIDYDYDYSDGAVAHTHSVAIIVPEPATMVLLGLGGIGVLIRRKRR